MGQSRLTVGLVQIGDIVWERRPSRQFHLVDGALRPKPLPANAHAASLAYLPHAAGLLQAYVSKYAVDASSIDFLVPLYKRLPLEQAVEHLSTADVLGFSIYVWNVQLSLAIARELKRQRPEVLVVMGGPQVPDQAEDFLQTNRFVDVVCHGEGERTFLEILERRDMRDWRGVQSTSFLDGRGEFVANPPRQRMSQLDEIPSPMLEGAYDKLMLSAPDQQWLATWETNRGCPFSCAFCDWGSATGSKVARYSEERLFQEIEWLAERAIQHLFVCDANFGMLPRDVEIARRLSETYARRRLPVAISVQSTKNRPDRSEEIQRVFKQAKVVSFGASISLQSVDKTVLKAIQRENISLEAFERLQKHYANEGLDTYTDLIVGLPSESYESFSRGVDSVIRNGQLNRVAFYECFVLPNAPMAQPDYLKRYGIETVPMRISQPHEPLERDESEEPEFIDMVIATESMSPDDWVRARVFAYFTELLFYDRLLHVPLTILSVGFGLDFRLIMEAFINAAPSKYPIVAATSRILERHTRSRLSGGPQYIASAEWLGLWWPADQYVLIELAEGNKLDGFYDEARALLAGCAAAAGHAIDPVLIDEAVRLNQAMFALPFQMMDEIVETSYPVAEAYLALLAGQQPLLTRRPSACRVARNGTIWMSWTDWCEDLVRRVYLRKYYLNPIHPVTSQSLDPLQPIGESWQRHDQSRVQATVRSAS